MRILVNSPYFHPRVGGLESVVMTLCMEWTRQGHQVQVHTESTHDGPDNFPFRVTRNPGRRQMLSAMRWCDVFHQPGLSLRNVWPMALVPRPWVVAHHIWYQRDEGGVGWQDVLKQALAYGAHNIAVSNAIARHVHARSVVIGNPYRSDLFRLLPGERPKDVVFVGRLIREKGAHVLLEALSLLSRRSGRRVSATVVGTGPEHQALMSQVQALGLADQVEMAGQVTGERLVQLLNRHKVMAVPSIWEEPFGVVALEGAASGCAVVASATGGLPDAVGPCGALVPKEDAGALAQEMERLLNDPVARRVFSDAAAAHLAAHTPEAVARRYLEVFAAACAGWPQRWQP